MNNNILLRLISHRRRALNSLTPAFFLFDGHKQTHTHTQTYIFKGERMLHCHYQWTQRVGGWDKIHQIWWHGDVDNVFFFFLLAQLREKKADTTTFTLSHPMFWKKGSTMYWVCVSNMSLCAQTQCPFTYQNDCPTIMWFNGKTHKLLIWLPSSGSETGLVVDKKKKKNIIIQFLICLHKYDRKPLKNRSTLR